MDFVVPTQRQARAYIREGAPNGIDLLTEAGMIEAEAKAELARIEATS